MWLKTQDGQLVNLVRAERIQDATEKQGSERTLIVVWPGGGTQTIWRGGDTAEAYSTVVTGIERDDRYMDLVAATSDHKKGVASIAASITGGKPPTARG